MKKLTLILVAGIFLLSLAGCKKKEKVKVIPPTEKKVARTGEEVKEKPIPKPVVQEESIEDMSLEEINRKGYLQRIHFDFDKYNIREDQKPILIKNAQWLKAHPTVKILIEGHCDERGTEEYNLALGEKRAKAVRDFLISLGISPDRIKIVSYGKSRPLDPRHNEEAWAKNRRAEFVIIAK